MESSISIYGTQKFEIKLNDGSNQSRISKLAIDQYSFKIKSFGNFEYYLKCGNGNAEYGILFAETETKI